MAKLRKFAERQTNKPVFVNADLVVFVRSNSRKGTDIHFAVDQWTTVEEDVENVVRTLDG